MSLRITFVLPCFDLSGGVRVVAQYASALHRRGHEVLVVGAPPAAPTLRGRARAALRERRWLAAPGRGPSHLDGRGVPHRLLDRARPLRDRDVPDADVIVATWWETAEWVAALSPRKGAKVHFVQGDEASPLWQSAARAGRAAAAHILPLRKIAISRKLLEMLRDRYAVSDAALVPNGVDLDLFHAPTRGRAGRPTVGLLYATMPLKGVDLALDAVRRAAPHVPGLRVVAFGVEPISSALPLPPGSHYERQPPQHHLRELYAQCDVWLCGSRSEGFHLPPLEAMACRTPVVSTAVGGPADVIEDGENGWLVPIGDVAALSDRLIDVLRAPDDRWRALSSAARATAQRSSLERATDRLEAALLEAAASEGARAAA
jgi:glycosyltransferase involved in cell wall biosynthesis